MTRLLDCTLEVNKFEPQLRCYVHFQTTTLEKGMNPLISPSIGKIVSLQFSHKDCYDIK